MPSGDRLFAECADIGVVDVNRAAILGGSNRIYPRHCVVLPVGIDERIHALRTSHSLPLREGVNVLSICVSHGEGGHWVIAESRKRHHRAVMREVDGMYLLHKPLLCLDGDVDLGRCQITPLIFEAVLIRVFRV